jgi:uncharacterized membrane protein YgaE (UPF0421/DUF939 family)
MTSPGLVPSFVLSSRVALAAGIAVAVANALELPFPIYALIAAVIVTDLSPARTRELAAPRMFGTVLGALLGAAACEVLAPGAISAGLCVFAAMSLTCAMRMENAARLAGYLAALVVLGYRDSPWTYGLYRLIETTIGIAVAVLVSLLPRPMDNEPGPLTAESH